MDETYGSHRVGSPHLPLLEQRQDHRWFDCRAARLCRCRAGRGGYHTEEEKVTWWCQHVKRLPRWSVVVKQALFVQPSSAVAERASFLLSAAFSDQQDSMLADYLQASVMLLYNKR